MPTLTGHQKVLEQFQRSAAPQDAETERVKLQVDLLQALLTGERETLPHPHSGKPADILDLLMDAPHSRVILGNLLRMALHPMAEAAMQLQRKVDERNGVKGNPFVTAMEGLQLLAVQGAQSWAQETLEARAIRQAGLEG